MSRSPLTDRTNYDFVLKFLLVGDGDVGKEEMLDNFENGASDLPFGFPSANGMILVTRNPFSINALYNCF